jgi:fibronectin type 3 domain-containing protein
VQASDNLYTDRVAVTWNAQAQATSYRVYRWTTNNFASAVVQGTVVSTSFDDTSATAGVQYYYWIEPVNTFGTGPVSASDAGMRSIVSNVSGWELM